MKEIAIVTGASGGMGKLFAESLEKHRKVDEIWVIARSADKLVNLRNTVKAPVKAIPMDLCKEESYAEFERIISEEKPSVKLLVNCAGYGKFDAFENLTMEENIGMIDLNCKALTALTYLSLPYMDKGSEILNVASVAAFQPIPYIGVYGASKAYVLSFSRALGREVRKRGIRVFAVCPFWTKTAFFDRAVDKEKKAVIKKYVAMYDPNYIVDHTWKKMKTKKDYCIPGFKAKAQVLAVKLLPHSIVMRVWEKQQKFD